MVVAGGIFVSILFIQQSQFFFSCHSWHLQECAGSCYCFNFLASFNWWCCIAWMWIWLALVWYLLGWPAEWILDWAWHAGPSLFSGLLAQQMWSVWLINWRDYLTRYTHVPHAEHMESCRSDKMAKRGWDDVWSLTVLCCHLSPHCWAVNRPLYLWTRFLACRGLSSESYFVSGTSKTMREPVYFNRNSKQTYKHNLRLRLH